MTVSETPLQWMAAVRHAGANPATGTQPGRVPREAGLTDIDGFGLQRRPSADDPVAQALLSAIVKSLAPVIVAVGVASEEELALDTFSERLVEDVQAKNAVGLPPAVVGARGRKTQGAGRK